MNQSKQNQINGVLKDYRKEINFLDEEIIKLIGKRFKIVRKLAKIKEENEIPVFLPNRILEVTDRAVSLAKKYDVDPKFIYGMYNSMIMHSCLLEEAEISKEKVKK